MNTWKAQDGLALLMITVLLAGPSCSYDMTRTGLDAAKPDAEKPDAAESDTAKSDAAKPDAGKPDAAKPDAAKPADAAKHDAVKPDTLPPLTAGYALIPAGTFTMGSPSAELCRTVYEDLHKVTLTHAFEISKTEVTQTQFSTWASSNPSYHSGANFPVENVTWHQAVAYCNALSKPKGYEECYTCSGSGAGVSCSTKFALFF